MWDFGTENQYPTLRNVGARSITTGGDRAAPVAIYNATGGDNWTLNTNWLTDAPLEKWHGVTTNNNGRVVFLRLPDNGLSGTLPDELGDLTGLALLDLGENRLRGTISAALGRLTSLGSLYLDDRSYFRGLTWSDIGSVPNLERQLNDDRNYLHGELPPELGNLAKLRVLNLSKNRLSGSLQPLAGLASLRQLWLSENSFSDGCIPRALSAVPRSDLVELAIPFCAALGTPPGDMPSAQPVHQNDRPALAGFYAATATDGADWTKIATDDNCSIDVARVAAADLCGVVAVSSSGRVTELRLIGKELKGTIPGALQGLNELTSLNLSYNDFAGAIPPQLGNLTNLTVLDLSDDERAGFFGIGHQDGLTGAAPIELTGLSNLTELDLSCNHLTGNTQGLFKVLEKYEYWAVEVAGNDRRYVAARRVCPTATGTEPADRPAFCPGQGVSFGWGIVSCRAVADVRLPFVERHPPVWGHPSGVVGAFGIAAQSVGAHAVPIVAHGVGGGVASGPAAVCA